MTRPMFDNTPLTGIRSSHWAPPEGEASMTWTASVRLDLPGWLTLDSKDELIEKVRETALPIEAQDGKSVAVQWTADNEWDLRGAVQETLEEVESNFDWRGLTDNVIDKVQRWQGEAAPFA